MNEKIKLLAEQAGITDNNLSDGNMSHTDLKKFAELIVKESIDWLAMNEEDAKALREHFGVEE